MFIYYFVKLLAQIALRIFFKKYQVEGLNKLKAVKPPMIVVGNHPNTFMDPVIVATLIKQQVGFVGNASVFNKYSLPILNYFKVIPIYRKKDMSNQVLSQSVLNNVTFKRCYEFLEKKGTLLLFPEGTSEIERRLREIKTGTARIALGVEYQNNFEIGLKILPIGINYSDPTRFRSEVFVNVGEPILVSDFKTEYDPERFDAVEALTNRIEQQLRELTIVTEDEEEDVLVKNIEILYKNQLFESLNLSSSEKKNEFLLIGQIIQAIRFFEANQPAFFSQIRTQMSEYTKGLNQLKLSDEVVGHSQKESIASQFIITALIALLGLPFYLFGLVNNYLPYALPLRISNAITSDISYKGPILMTAGIFTFLGFYGVQMWVVQHFFQNIWLTLMYAIVSALCGFFALWYWNKVKKLRELWQTNRLFLKHPKEIVHLLEQRKELFVLLEAAKREFIVSPQTIKKFI